MTRPSILRGLPSVLGAALIFSVFGLGLAGPARAQMGGNSFPRDSYFLAMQPFHSGEYKTALQVFERELRSGANLPEGPWLDSICYYTMAGECFYQMGDMETAVQRYEAALRLAVVHNGWMLRVQWPTPDTITAANITGRNRPTWGVSARATAPARMNDTMIIIGATPNLVVGTAGGGVPAIGATRSGRALIAGEVIRCTALSLRRYVEILGPVTKHLPLAAQVLDAFSRRPAPVNHWSQAWMSAQLGLAHAAMGQRPQATSELQQALVIGGQLDHVLTPLVLLELGKLAVAEGRIQEAGVLLMEATYCGALLEQPDIVEEAFRHAAALHASTNQANPFEPLSSAAQWTSRQRNYVHLRASLLTLAAESFAEHGQTNAASNALGEAEKAMARREMSAGLIGARWQRVGALVNYQQGNIAEGDKRLAAMAQFQRKGSPRLAQIALADKLFSTDVISPRVACDLFADVMREPTTKDWALEPQETLGVVMTPVIGPMEHWFDAAMIRKEPKQALEIADRVRRRRFFSSLPMGGRLMALRWVLEAPASALDQQAMLQRQDLLARYPNYAALSRQAVEAKVALSAMPLTVDKNDRAAVEQQRKLFAQWQKAATAQEVLLREMAVRRGPSDFVFPPLRTAAAMQSALAPGEGALVFFATNRYVIAFAFDNKDFAHWQVENSPEVIPKVGEMLKTMGHFDRNQVIDAKQLQDHRWKTHAGQIYATLMAGAPAGVLDRWQRIAIVPDNILWHVPFEILPRDTAEGPTLLIETHRLRYLPTASLLAGDGRGTPTLAKTAIVAGKLFPRDGEAAAQAAAEDLRHVLPGAQQLQDLAGSTKLVSALCDRLVVLDDIDDADRLPYDWSPAQLDNVTLNQWMSLPWGASQQLVLPGFHTAAENALKRGGNGDEVFLTVCGLLSSGVRTALLSRWRTGGQSSIDLTREFVQELPHVRADEAWQRSVLLARANSLDPSVEPRVKVGDSEAAFNGSHPFLWSGYLLIDIAGSSPSQGGRAN